MFLVADPPPLPRPAPPQRVLVFAREFRFQPSKRVVRPGRVRIQVKNIGEDAHNLVVFNQVREVASTGIIQPGELKTITIKLRPGRYAMICTVGNHFQRGMHKPLFVRPKKKTKTALRKSSATRKVVVTR